jgi:hypothetical protein
MNAHIKPHNGVPTLFLDDQPAFASHQWLSTNPGPNGFPGAECVRLFGEAGVHIYAIAVGASNEWCGHWCGASEEHPDHYDFSMVEAQLRAIIKEDPAALFHLRMYFETPAWWNQLHPDECEITHDGQRQNQSYASQVWRDDVKDYLRAYVQHLKAIGMYDRVIAYQVQAGVCGEWIKSPSAMQSFGTDYSAPMLRHFRGWLRKRYGTDAVLQATWHNAEVTLDTAVVPSGDEQLNAKHHLFRDPMREENVVDYYRCLAELVADDVIELCATVKQLTDGNKLAGAFFGYLMDLAWNDNFFGAPTSPDYSTIQRSGHLGLRKVLQAPEVDYIVSPYGYAFRGLGGDGLPMPPTESVRLHNKMYILEEDSHLHNEVDPAGRNFNRKHTVAIYQREFTQTITHGLGIWWFADWPAGSYAKQNPNFQPWLVKFQKLGTWAMQLNRAPQSEVAVVVDDESFMYESLRNSIDLPLIFRQRVTSLPRFGAPHDVYLLNDVLEGKLPEYKLYVFLNCFALNQTRRDALKQLVQRDNKTALWLYAPGYLKPGAMQEQASIVNMTELTGFTFERHDNMWGPFMHVTDFQHPITQDIPQDLFWGTTAPLGPLFHLDDADATELGQVVYSLGRCKPGLGIKSIQNAQGGWNSVYCATPDVPAPLLRGIARFAGVHLYSDAGDVLHATPDLLGVHTVSGGQRDFALPRRVEVVYDLFNDKIIAENADHFAIRLQPASTSLFYTGSRKLLESL